MHCLEKKSEKQKGLHSGRNAQLFRMGNTKWQSGRHSRSRGEWESQLCYCEKEKKRKKITILRRVRESSCKAQEAIPQLCRAVAKLSLGHRIHFGASDFKERNELSEKAPREKDRRSRKHDLWSKTERSGRDQAKLGKTESGHNNSFYNAIAKKQGTVCSLCLWWIG